MDPIKTLQSIVQISKLIYSQVEKMQANREQAQRIVARVRQIVASLQGLSTLPQQKQFVDSLKALEACLSDLMTFMKQFQEMGGIKKFFLAGKNQETFEGYNGRLAGLLPQLNVGLSAQQLMNREHDKRDREKDRQQDQAIYQTLLSQQGQILRELQGLHLAPEDLNAIVGRQIQSLEMRMKAYWQEQQTPQGSGPTALLSSDACVNFYDVTCLEKIGEGSFGSIYRGLWQKQSVAVKLIERAVTEEDRQQFIREAQVMSRLHSDYVSPFRGACIEPGRLCLLMGLAEKGDLRQVLAREGHSLDLVARLQIALDLAKGLHYLHQQGVVHGDIKPKNILMNRHNEAKWTDFGLAKTRFASVASLGGSGGSSPEACWQAPESWEMRGKLTEASDVYSFGLVLWHLLTGRQPYADCSPGEIISKIKSGHRERLPSVPGEIPAAYAGWVSLIEACWCKNPLSRPHSIDIIHHLEAIHAPAVIHTLARSASPTGEVLYQQGVAHQQRRADSDALACYEQSMRKGYVKALTSVGFFALQGLGGCPQDKAKAVALFQQAAEAGHARAMINLANMFGYGDGVTQDYKQAYEWANKACEAGEANGKELYQKFKARYDASQTQQGPQYMGLSRAS